MRGTHHWPLKEEQGWEEGEAGSHLLRKLLDLSRLQQEWYVPRYRCSAICIQMLYTRAKDSSVSWTMNPKPTIKKLKFYTFNCLKYSPNNFFLKSRACLLCILRKLHPPTASLALDKPHSYEGPQTAAALPSSLTPRLPTLCGETFRSSSPLP